MWVVGGEEGGRGVMSNCLLNESASETNIDRDLTRQRANFEQFYMFGYLSCLAMLYAIDASPIHSLPPTFPSESSPSRWLPLSAKASSGDPWQGKSWTNGAVHQNVLVGSFLLLFGGHAGTIVGLHSSRPITESDIEFKDP